MGGLQSKMQEWKQFVITEQLYWVQMNNIVWEDSPSYNWHAACSEWNEAAAHKDKLSLVQLPTSKSATQDSANWNQ